MADDFLTHEQIQEYRDAFSLFDKDGDGQLLFSELIGLLHALGQMYTAEEVTDIMKDFDVSGEGLINFREFLTLVTKMIADYDSVREAFDIIGSAGLDDDTSCGTTVDRLSSVTLMEYLSTMGENARFTEDDVEKMLRELGLPEDGGDLTVDHFLKFVNSM